MLARVVARESADPQGATIVIRDGTITLWSRTKTSLSARFENLVRHAAQPGRAGHVWID